MGWEEQMSAIAWRKTSWLIGPAAAALMAAGAFAAQTGTPPDFGSDNTGWVSIGTDYEPVPGSPPPVSFDPAHRYVPNGSGEQPTFRVADLNNPNLTQFAKDGLKKSNDMVLSGFAMYARESRCWATGVPTYLLNPAQPTFILQEPKKVTMMWQMDQQVRHIYMDVPHSRNPKPSWYGESVGHYEGAMLVVDTIGQNTQTFIDNYRTPHSDKLHVIERFHLVDGGNTLQADITIEDPVALAQPLRVVHKWRKVQGPMTESRCADGESFNPFSQQAEPIPTASKFDF
jgi:hypothetical protein